MTQSEKPILVFGGTGFLGTRICEILKKEGHDVISIGRNQDKLDAMEKRGFEAHSIDLSQKDASFAIREFLYDRKVGAIINAAGNTRHWGDTSHFESGNLDPARVCVHLKETQEGMRVVQISSASVHADMKDRIMIREDAPRPKPLNTYARTKGEADDLIHRTFGKNCVILRPRAIIGKGERALLPPILNAARSGPIIRVSGSRPFTQLTHVNDVARAAVMALCAPEEKVGGRIFHIAGKEQVDLHGLIDTACAAKGIKNEWKDLPWGAVFAAAKGLDLAAMVMRNQPRFTPYLMSLLTYSMTMDCRSAKEAFGWEPEISFSESFEEVFGTPCPSDLITTS
jgi:nucleoside-diphosphate-sugar epimerase